MGSRYCLRRKFGQIGWWKGSDRPMSRAVITDGDQPSLDFDEEILQIVLPGLDADGLVSSDLLLDLVDLIAIEQEIEPLLESPALKSAYLQAREQLDLPPNPDMAGPLLPQAASSPQPEPSPAKVEASGQQPASDSSGAMSQAMPA